MYLEETKEESNGVFCFLLTPFKSKQASLYVSLYTEEN